MFDDDLEPKNKPAMLKNLEPMSLDEMEKYIVDLQDEIKRTTVEIEKKKSHMSAAASVFK